MISERPSLSSGGPMEGEQGNSHECPPKRRLSVVKCDLRKAYISSFVIPVLIPESEYVNGDFLAWNDFALIRE